ncbi:MAG: SDR family NAD(P)-dependent oxidoreductase [Alphaproteobacteria bacterium]
MKEQRTNVVLVTGAAGALGSLIVARFLGRGWSVAALDRAAPDEAGHERCLPITADLARDGAIDAALSEALARFGEIDLLVNAVGEIHSEPVLRFERGRLVPHQRASWARIIEANLSVPFLTAAAVAAVMARQPRRGVIVNVSSVAARGNEGQAAYAAAKAGLEAATKVMARELGPLGVRVNAVAPGFIDTASTHAALARERLDRLVASTPLRRLGTGAEVVDAIEFCWENAFLAGAVIAVDGGIIV